MIEYKSMSTSEQTIASTMYLLSLSHVLFNRLEFDVNDSAFNAGLNDHLLPWPVFAIER